MKRNNDSLFQTSTGGFGNQKTLQNPKPLNLKVNSSPY
jgi:hypothetical protein